jgi:signal transduction histidine kinase
VWYSCALAVILLTFAVGVIWLQGRVGIRRVDRELNDLTTTVTSLLRDELTEVATPDAAAREVLEAVSAAGRHAAILDSSGHMLGQDASGLRLLAPTTDPPAGTDTWRGTTPGGEWRVAGRHARIGNDSFIVLAGAPLADVSRERREAERAMWLGLPALFALSAIGGLWLAGIALRPITTMAQRAATLPVVGDGDLGHAGRDDELGQLERSFNGLLARLRASLQTERQFMADASHELRTPVSVVRSVVDVTLDRPNRDEVEYREALHSIDIQARHMGRLLDDMLTLARADADGYPLRREHLYLDELLHGCARALAEQAQERGVSIEVHSEPDVAFEGDLDLLRRMVLNLLRNALEHSPAGRRVDATLIADETTVTIVVADQGAGIAPEDRERIFNRFVQLDPSRRRAGAGLGLPIARWIAEMHGGSLALQSSSASGSVFAARLARLAGDSASQGSLRS